MRTSPANTAAAAANLPESNLYAAVDTAESARQTCSEVSGMSRCVTPRTATASRTAATTALRCRNRACLPRPLDPKRVRTRRDAVQVDVQIREIGGVRHRVVHVRTAQ